MDNQSITHLKLELLAKVLSTENEDKLLAAYHLLEESEADYKTKTSLSIQREIEIALDQVAKGETISWLDIKAQHK